jgi:hypothetical protein
MTKGEIIRTIIGIPFGMLVVFYGVTTVLVNPDDNTFDWIFQAAYVGLLLWLGYWLLKPLIARVAGNPTEEKND